MILCPENFRTRDVFLCTISLGHLYSILSLAKAGLYSILYHLMLLIARMSSEPENTAKCHLTVEVDKTRLLKGAGIYECRISSMM